jgi:hypothetical protein
MILGRFILRFLLVPFGIAAAALAGIAVVMIGEWNAFVAFVNANPDSSAEYFVAATIAAPFLLMMLGGAALTMLAPGAIGILISEFFALRSWMFHVGNGAVSAWVGWSMFDGPRDTDTLFHDPKLIVVMGLMAGVTYWLVAGWSAGFWRPVFGPDAPLAPPPESPAKSV